MAGARRPPALRHGLSSRLLRGEWSEDAVILADAILGPSPREPALLEAAGEDAEAILYLRRVQQCRLAILEECALCRYARSEAEKSLVLTLSGAVKRGHLSDCRTLRDDLFIAHDREWRFGLTAVASSLLLQDLGRRLKDLQRLADYERRAFSRRKETLRRLDYERVEAERRHARAEAARSRGAGRG